MLNCDILTKYYINDQIVTKFGRNDIEKFTLEATESKYFHMNECEDIMRIRNDDLKRKFLLSVLNKKDLSRFLTILRKIWPGKNTEWQNLYGENNQSSLNPAWVSLQQKLYQSFKSLFTIKPLKFKEIEPIRLEKIFTTVKMVRKKVFLLSDMENYTQNIVYENFYELFQQNFCNILVMGKPGIGKSVHALHLLYTHSKRKWNILNEKIILVILLKKVGKQENIYDAVYEQNFKHLEIPFIANECETTKKEIYIKVIKEKPDNFLLFIDGVDEYNFNDQSIKEVIQGQKIIVKTILWSRNHAVKDHLLNYTYVFELLGLRKNQLHKFFNENITNTKHSRNFLLKLREDKDKILERLCQVPLLALMIFFVWRKNENEFSFENPYNFFEKFIEILHKENDFDVRKKVNKSLFARINELCFKDISKNSIVVSEDEGKIFEKSNCLKDFTEFVYCENECRIQFYHLSIQEFLAAKYLIKYSDEDKKILGILGRQPVRDEMIRDINKSRLINIFLFIKQGKGNLFEYLCSQSTTLKQLFNLSEKIESKINNLAETNYILNIQDETIEYNSFENFSLKIKNVREIHFLNVSIQVFEFLTVFLDVDPNNLEKFVLDSRDNIYSSPIYQFYDNNFLEIFLNFIEKTKLNVFQIGKIKYEICCHRRNDGNSIEKISISDGETDGEIFTIDLTVEFGSKCLCIFEDKSCKVYKTVTVNILRNQIISGAEIIHLENKIFDSNLSRNFFTELEDNVQIHAKNCLIKNMTDFMLIEIFNKTKSCNNQDNIDNLNDDKFNSLFSIFQISEMKFCLFLNVSSPIEIMDLIEGETFGNDIESIVLTENNLSQVFKLFRMRKISFHYLNLEKYPFTYDSTNNLKHGLSSANNSIALNLSGNFRGMHRNMLSNIFNENSLKIHSLNLRNCQLSESVIQVLSNSSFRYLKSIDLSFNPNLVFCFYKLMNKITENGALRILKLQNCFLSENEGERLTEIFQTKHLPIEILDLSMNESLHKSLDSLIDSMHNFQSTIESLSLSKCNLSREQAENLGEKLSLCTNLKELNLSYNLSIGIGFIKIFKCFENCRKIKSLDFSNTYFNANLAELLSNKLENLQDLEIFKLDGNPEINDGIIGIVQSLMSHCTKITVFSLWNCNISVNYEDFLANCFARFSNLKELNLNGNFIMNKKSDQIILTLTNFVKSLKILHLSECNILSSGENNLIDFFSKASLKSLNLGFNATNSNNINMTNILRNSLKTLQYLNIEYCELNKCQLEQVFQTITSSITIKILNVNGNDLSVVDFKNMTNTNESILEDLSFSDCNLNDKVGENFSKFLGNLTNITYLDMSKNCGLRDFLEIFVQSIENSIRNLKVLNLSQCQIDNDKFKEIIKLLQNCSNLEYLNLNENFNKYVDTRSIEYIGSDFLNEPNLIELNLSSCLNDLTYRLERLFNCKNLETIILRKNPIYSEKLLFSLRDKRTKFLKKLDLSECSLTESAGKSLSRILSYSFHIESINLNNNMNLKKSLFEIIESLRISKLALKNLELSNCCLAASHIEKLTEILFECCQIQTINISSNKNCTPNLLSKLLISLLKSKNCLKYLDISNLKFKSSEIENILKYLEEFKHLESLNISGTFWRNDNFWGFLTCLKNCSVTLKYLNISNSTFFSLNESNEHMHCNRCVFDQLIELNLGSNAFNNDQWVNIFDWIENSKDSLKILNLSQCLFKKDQFENLHNLLNKCKRLEILNLSNLNIRFQLIFRSLFSSKSVINTLDLSFCSLNDTDGFSLMQLFSSLKYLKFLNLKKFSNGTWEITNFIHSFIELSTTLKQLDFSDCLRTKEDYEQFFQTLSKMHVIETVKVTSSYDREYVKSSFTFNELHIQNFPKTLKYLSVNNVEFDVKDQNLLYNLSELSEMDYWCTKHDNFGGEFNFPGKKLLSLKCNEKIPSFLNGDNLNFLENLQVGKISSKTDLNKLRNCCKELKRLTINDINEFAIKFITECNNLEEFYWTLNEQKFNTKKKFFRKNMPFLIGTLQKTKITQFPRGFLEMALEYGDNGMMFVVNKAKRFSCKWTTLFIIKRSFMFEKSVMEKLEICGNDLSNYQQEDETIQAFLRTLAEFPVSIKKLIFTKMNFELFPSIILRINYCWIEHLMFDNCSKLLQFFQYRCSHFSVRKLTIISSNLYYFELEKIIQKVVDFPSIKYLFLDIQFIRNFYVSSRGWEIIKLIYGDELKNEDFRKVDIFHDNFESFRLTIDDKMNDFKRCLRNSNIIDYEMLVRNVELQKNADPDIIKYFNYKEQDTDEMDMMNEESQITNSSKSQDFSDDALLVESVSSDEEVFLSSNCSNNSKIPLNLIQRNSYNLFQESKNFNKTGNFRPQINSYTQYSNGNQRSWRPSNFSMDENLDSNSASDSSRVNDKIRPSNFQFNDE